MQGFVGDRFTCQKDDRQFLCIVHAHERRRFRTLRDPEITPELFRPRQRHRQVYVRQEHRLHAGTDLLRIRRQPRMRSTLVVAAALATALTACSGGAPSVPAAGNVTALRPGPSKPVCGEAAPGFERCFAWIRTDIHGKKPGSTPSGYGPSDLQTAYGL